MSISDGFNLWVGKTLGEMAVAAAFIAIFFVVVAISAIISAIVGKRK